MADLHRRLLVRCDPAWYGLRDNPPPTFAALRAVLDKCATMRAEHQVGAFIAEEFERVIAEQLGVPIDKSITEKESPTNG